MRHRWHKSIVLAVVGVVASSLACNAPTATPSAPTPSVVPDTPTVSPTQASPEATPTPAPPATTEAAATETPAPTDTAVPPNTTPRPTPPASTGPLDFAVPARLDSWRSLPDGKQEATIILHITGGAPPYTVHHDLDVFTTWEADPAIVFEARGCSALVHTIVVESADGQSVTHDYWIAVPWCE
jgi:hypothetical protein